MEEETIFNTVRTQLLSQLGPQITGRVSVDLSEYPQWLQCSIQERVNLVFCEDDTILDIEGDHKTLSLGDSIITRGYLGLAPITEMGCYCRALMSRVHRLLRNAEVVDGKLHAVVPFGAFLTPTETVANVIRMSMPNAVINIATAARNGNSDVNVDYALDTTIDFLDIMKLADLRSRW
jgi:hypothetical protein